MLTKAVSAVLLVLLCRAAAQNCTGSCNGHASVCFMDARGEVVCECEDNTTGPSCAECLPFYQDRPWEPGTPDDSNPCIACRCNNHSTECTFDLEIYLASGNISGGVCVNCQDNTEGTNCDRCSLGYRRDVSLPLSSENACTVCPACFDQVAVVFNETVQQYQELLLRVNSTAEGTKLSPEIIMRLEQYEQTLKELLEIAENVTQREPQLLSDVMGAAMEAESYSDFINQFAANVSEAENATARLNIQVNESVVLLQQLQSIVAMIEISLRNESQLKLDEAIQLVDEYVAQFGLLVNLSSEAIVTAGEQENTAFLLLIQAMQALNYSTEAFDLLCQAISLQSETTAILDTIEKDRLPLLEEVYERGLQALSDAERDVPLALNQSRVVLERVQSLIIPVYNVTLLRRDVTDLENQANLLLNSTSTLNSELQELRTNFSELSARAERLLEESQNLSGEAGDLELRVHGANSDAVNSEMGTNLTFVRAREILEQLQERLEDAEDFATGLAELIMNIGRAENYSGVAEAGANASVLEIREAVRQTTEAAMLLNETTNRLEEALLTAMQADATASGVLDNATALNSSSHDLANNVTKTERTVTALEEQAAGDKANIAEANASAHDAIATSREVQTRIVDLRMTLLNLSRELNATTLLPPERLESINVTVSSLEERAEVNQVVVDELTEQVRLLEESSEELRRRYIELQQHRDLLQEILDNIDELNCRAQFV